MGQVIEGLLRLQEIENELIAVREHLEKLERTQSGQQRRIEQLRQEISEKQDLARRQQSSANQLELELKSHESEIAKLRSALNRAKTNKEYAAILTQINTQKADNSKLEDRLLQLFSQNEQLNEQLKALHQQLQSEQQKLQQITEQNEGTRKQLQARRQQLEQKFEEAAKDMPPSAVAIFRRVAETYNGQVMAEIQQVNPKRSEFNCGGCFMSVPMETINTLMTKDEILRCPNCQRILYLADRSEIHKTTTSKK